MPRLSIYDAAGGAPAMLALATAHHLRCLADPVLEHPFSHPGHPDHIQRLAWYWGEVLGGPPAYTACSDGDGQAGALWLHAHMDAQADMGERFLACFLAAADDAGLPDNPELRQALRDYMTWAVDQFMVVNPKGAPVPEATALPRWGWEGLLTAG